MKKLPPEAVGDVEKITRDERMNEQELSHFSRVVVDTTKEMLELIAEKKRVMKEFADVKKELQQKIKDTVQIVSTGLVTRTHSCVPVPNYTNFTMEYHSIENGELIKVRPLTVAERQTSIPISTDETTVTSKYAANH